MGKDRISSLHDALLIRILSFLPTKCAVRTSLLSKRWETLFISLPDFFLFDYQYSSRRYDGLEMNFVNFIDRIFTLRPHDLNLNKFAIQCCESYDLNRLDGWVRNASRLNVKELSVGFPYVEVYDKILYKMVGDVYMCNSLENLVINGNILIEIPGDVVLPRLKHVDFSRVHLSSCESVQKLLLNCPALEKLVFKSCRGLDGGGCISVCSSALKVLCFDFYYPVEIELRIGTPALETLQIGSISSEDIHIEGNLQFLTKAIINVQESYEQDVPSDVYGDSVFELVRKLFHVKSLCLSEKTIRALDHASEYRFPMFQNLTNLELAWCGFDFMPDILASSPNLQRLAFPMGLQHIVSPQFDDFSWTLPEFVSNGLFTHLETIELGSFRQSDTELSFVKYFLKHGEALRKLSIYCSDKRYNMEILEELLNSPRASSTCKIELPLI